MTDILNYYFDVVPLRGPYLYPLPVASYEVSVSYHLSPIHSSDVRGRLLGYKVSYAPMGEPNNKTTIQVGANSTMVNLRHLKGGFKYIIATAGFTRKGTGRYTFVSSTCKFKIRSTNPIIINNCFQGNISLFSDSHNSH